MNDKKKIALITGASTGLGKSMALKLSKKGFDTILASRNFNKLEEISHQISGFGSRSYPFMLDVRNEQSVNDLKNFTKDIGFVDVIINNAGFGKFDEIRNLQVKDWDEQMSVNLRGSFLITKYFCNDMINQKIGTIVFINSVAGKKAYPYSSAYVTSKFGLLGFSRSLREELREYNIKVISVHPGAISTPFWENVEADFSKDDMMDSDNVAETIVHAVLAPDNVVLEEIDIQRTLGDF